MAGLAQFNGVIGTIVLLQMFSDQMTSQHPHISPALWASTRIIM